MSSYLNATQRELFVVVSFPFQHDNSPLNKTTSLKKKRFSQLGVEDLHAQSTDLNPPVQHLWDEFKNHHNQHGSKSLQPGSEIWCND